MALATSTLTGLSSASSTRRWRRPGRARGGAQRMRRGRAQAFAGTRRRDDAVEQVAFAGRLDQLEGHARFAPLHGIGRALFQTSSNRGRPAADRS
jgi:hypothetical protein